MDNWLSVTIVLENEKGEEEQICYSSKHIIPRKGEYVWMPYNWERKKEFGTRAFIVEDVAHHMPLDGTGVPYDSIVVYVSKVEKDE